MTVIAIGVMNNKFVGLSTDTKPTDCQEGSSYYSVDTGCEWIFYGTTWYLKYDPSKGVPPSFSKMTASGVHVAVQKGQTNNYLIRPEILNEYCESFSDIVDEVNATTIVGQVFKASKDNINSIMLTLDSAEASSIDNFESYADSAALRTKWVKGGTNEADLETTIVASGGSTKAMRFKMDVLDDDWVYTLAAPADFTGYLGVFDYYQTKEYNKAKASIFIGDGVTTKSYPLVISFKNQWVIFQVDEAAMTEDGGGTTDITAITQIGFRIDDKEGGKFGYVDNLKALPPPGEVELNLWDFGATEPVAGTADLDGATQYTELGDRGNGAVSSSIILSLIGGKRHYHLHDFVAGAAKDKTGNTTLTIDNYYAITLHYVDTNVNVYGNSDSCYNNGFGFYAPDTSTAITDLSKDLRFFIFSTQDIYIVRVMWALHTAAHAVAAPGENASVMMVTEGIDENITGIVMTHIFPPATMDRELSLNPCHVEDGGKFEIYYEDDFTDSVAGLVANIQYKYEPPTING